MNETDRQNQNYLKMLADMENSWQEAVTNALSARENHRSVYQTVISGLIQQIKDREALDRQKEEEVTNLRATVYDLKNKLDLAQVEISRLVEESQTKSLDETAGLRLELEAKEKEIEELRSLHKQSVLELAAGAQNTLQELESQLEEVTAKEADYKSKIAELEETKTNQEQKLQGWNRVAKRMGEELNEVKNKLQSTRFANNKIKEEMALWKKYCEKVEEERKAVKREVELENRVLRKFNQIETFLKGEKQNRNQVVDLINHFGNNLVKDIIQLKDAKPKTLTSIGCQINIQLGDREDENKRYCEAIAILEQREMRLEEELKRYEMDLDSLRQQNITLREVVKGMKQEREKWEREKEHIEEEVRVARLEESVKFLKSNLMNGQEDISVWNALQDAKKEMRNLKNKNINKSTNKDSTLIGYYEEPTKQAALPLKPFRNK